MIPLMLMVLAASGVPAAPTELTVMSFNIRFATPNDGPNAWDHRRGFVVETIKATAPDVFGTQECLESQAEFLAGNLPDYHWFGMGRDPGGTGEFMAVFYRKDVLVPVAAGHFWLSETPDVPGTSSWDSACNRMVTWLRFYHRETHGQFLYLNTHFDHRSEAARRESAILLAQRVRDMAKGGPVVITGDFNAAAGDSDPWRTLTSYGLRDAWLEVETPQGPVGTFNGFRNPDTSGGRRIDWILTGGAVRVLHCETLTPMRGDLYVSDHWPVIARIALPSGGAAFETGVP